MRLPVSIRRYEAGDFARCMELYELNAPGRFPSDGAAGFQAALRKPGRTTLIATTGPVMIGVGGISVDARPSCYVAHLSYGMIDPEWHGRGAGTLLLLARVATLPRPTPWGVLKMANVSAAAPFYQRFGFGPYHEVDPDGLLRHAAAIDEDGWTATRRIVEACGICLDSLAVKAAGDS